MLSRESVSTTANSYDIPGTLPQLIFTPQTEADTMYAIDTSHQNQEEDDACGSKVPVRSTQVCEKLNPRGAVQKAEIRIKNGGGVHNEDTAKKFTKRNTAEQFGTISGRVQGTSVRNRSPGRLSGGTTRRTGHTLPAPLWAHPSGTSLGTPRAAKRGTTRCTGHTLLAPLWPPPEAWLHKFVSPLAAKKINRIFRGRHHRKNI